MSKIADLLPCPFCGGKADFSETNAWWVRCKECNAEAEADMSPEGAAEYWNRRTPPPSSRPRAQAPDKDTAACAALHRGSGMTETQNAWRLDKALDGYETMMDGSREAILRFRSDEEFMFFIDAMSKGIITAALAPQVKETPPPSSHVKPVEIPGELEMFEGKLTKVVDASRTGWWRFHTHRDRDGYCDNPARGY